MAEEKAGAGTGFAVRLVTPVRRVAETDAREVRLPLVTGFAGFRPGHAPLGGRLGIGVAEVDDVRGETHLYSVAGGFVEVKGDGLVVLADVAEAADDIDVARAQLAEQRAEERLRSAARQEVDVERAMAALARARARLGAASRR